MGKINKRFKLILFIVFTFLFTAADVWSFPTRDLTTSPTDISGLAEKTDLIPLAKTQYVNTMSTVFIGTDQQLLVWANKNGQQVVAVTNCSVIIKDANGMTKWDATSSAPNVDGVFKFLNPMTVSAKQQFYVIITVKVDGEFRTTQQSFFTVG